MKAYRIGREPRGPWTNRTPPLRGGVFQTETQAVEALDTSESQILDQEKRLIEGGYGSGVGRLPSRYQLHRSSLSPEPECATGSQVTSQGAAARGGASQLGDYTVNSKRPAGGVRITEARVALKPEEWTEWAIQQGKLNDRRHFPSLDPDIQGDIVSKYRLLHRRIQDEGLYSCPYVEYGKEMCRYTSLFGTFLYTLSHGWYITSAVFLGLFWVSYTTYSLPTAMNTDIVQHQVMFTAHDAGHRAITSIFVVDTLIGLFVANFCCGLSLGWWKSSHNVHHLITNMPVSPSRMQHLPDTPR
jgi:delta8-fatty-acid desaturase